MYVIYLPVRPIILAASLVVMAAARCHGYATRFFPVRRSNRSNVEHSDQRRASKLKSGSASAGSFREPPNVSIHAGARGGAR
jgi:hypothetical protein